MPPTDPAPRRLLLAEDDPVSAAFLAAGLESLGYAVVRVSDGAEALQLARDHAFAALMLDLGLPQVEGDTVLASLRSDPGAASRHAPALALSAETSPALARRLLGLGFGALLAKPLSMANLQRALEGILAGSPLALPAAPARTDAGAAEVLDDGAAMVAIGSADALADLRRLFAAELPGHGADVLKALDCGERAMAQGILHRLKSASRFCGAVQLSNAVDALLAALRAHATIDHERAQFAQAVASALGALDPESGRR
jgi:two-component system OmpR family response regulator